MNGAMQCAQRMTDPRIETGAETGRRHARLGQISVIVSVCVAAVFAPFFAVVSILQRLSESAGPASPEDHPPPEVLRGTPAACRART